MATTGEDTYIVEIRDRTKGPATGSTSAGRRVKSRARIAGRRIRSKNELKSTFLNERGARRPTLFVSWTAEALAPLSTVAHEEKGNLRLLLLEQLSPARKEHWQTLFRTVVSPGSGLKLIEEEELIEVLSAENRADLFVGGTLNKEEEVVVLYRGTLDRLSVPLAWFARRSDVEPDFDQFEVVDYGNTLRFGPFEVSSDAVLFDFDPEYRARANRRQRELDDSLGGSLRRLREARGVSRSDFPSVSAKTIARIERGEVLARAETLQKIARRLDVQVEEICTY